MFAEPLFHLRQRQALLFYLDGTVEAATQAEAAARQQFDRIVHAPRRVAIDKWRMQDQRAVSRGINPDSRQRCPGVAVFQSAPGDSPGFGAAEDFGRRLTKLTCEFAGRSDRQRATRGEEHARRRLQRGEGDQGRQARKLRRTRHQDGVREERQPLL